MKHNKLFISLLLITLSYVFMTQTHASSLLDKNTSINAENITYKGIYKQTIKLKTGSWSGISSNSAGASKLTAGLIKNFTFKGDLNGDGIDEQIVFLWASSGGSGTMIYLAVLGQSNGRLTNLASSLVGDRVQLIMGRVNQGQIELDVVQAKNNDSACCPTHKLLRRWSLKQNKNTFQLIEHKAQFGGRLSLADIQGVDWHLIKMNWSEALLADKLNVNLQFKKDKVSGHNGCNRYFASIKEAELAGNISISQIGSTRMACAGDATDIETRFMNALANVSQYAFVNGQLALTWKDGDANSTMLFSAQPLNKAQ